MVVAGGIAMAAVAAIRIVLFGWTAVAPDDARYLFVGLSLLAGDGPVTPSGNLFLLRSPVYGTVLAGGATAIGGDPVEAARVVAAALAVAGLIGAVGIGWLLRGGPGAVATAVAIASTPLIWRLLPTLRIDLPQTAGAVGVIVAIMRPTFARWALAGALLGLTILVKETIAVLAVLPLAFVGSVAPGRLARLTVVFLCSAALVAGWWWVFVWAEAGVVFPLNALAVIERREVGSDLRLDPVTIGALAVAASGWAGVARAARRDLGARLLAVAGVAAALPALYATANGLSARNYAGLAVLSAIAVGVAAVDTVAALRRRTVRRPAGRAIAIAVVLVVVAGLVVGQRAAGRPGEPRLPGDMAAWLRSETEPGDRIVMAFRHRELMALRLFGRVEVAGLRAVRVRGDLDPASFAWLGLRDRQLFGYRRESMAEDLFRPGTRFLVLSGPHALTPSELLPALAAGEAAGVSPATELVEGRTRADVFSVDPAVGAAAGIGLPLHATGEALEAWLDLAAAERGPDADAAGRLLGAAPIAVDPGLDGLLERLGATACAAEDPGPGAGIRLWAAAPSTPCGDAPG